MSDLLKNMMIVIITMICTPLYCMTGNIESKTELSLQDCLIYAKEHSLKNKQSEYAYRQSQIGKQNAIMAFLPEINSAVNANINYGRGVDPETNMYTDRQTLGSSYGVSVSLPLFDGLVNVNTYKLYRSYSRESKLNTEIEADNVSLSVIRAFYNVLYYSELVKQIESQLEANKGNLRKTMKEEELGIKSGAEVEQMRATVASFEYTLVNQQNLYENSLLELKGAMFWPIEKTLIISRDLTIKEDDRPFDIEYNVTANPKARASAEQLRQKILNHRIMKGYWSPSIYLNAGISTSYYKDLQGGYVRSDFNDQFKNNMGEYISTGVSIPLFDRMRRHNNVRNARLAVKIGEAANQMMVFELQKEAQMLILNLEGAKREYLASVSQLTAVMTSHRANQRMYEQGVISALELFTSSSKLAEANAAMTGKHIQYIIQKIQYDHFNGMPYINE